MISFQTCNFLNPHTMKTPRLHLLLSAALAVMSASAPAQVPSLLNYQGRVSIGGTNLTGTGQFKFALVNAEGSQFYWRNDGSTKTGEPSTYVTRDVQRGIYSLLLGDTTLSNMAAIPDTVFTNSDVRLRVWFRPAGTNAFALMSPDQRLGSSGYAIRAAAADAVNISNVPGDVTVGGSVTVGGPLISASTLELRSGGTTGWRVGSEIGDSNDAYFGRNIIGGYALNTVVDGVVGATISGGGGQETSAGFDSINEVRANFGTVGGGWGNVAGAFQSTVGGGSGNQALGENSTIGGGSSNATTNANSTIGGGSSNTAEGPGATVSGGVNNSATGTNSTVGGGASNSAGSAYVTIAGGIGNMVPDGSTRGCTIGGGISNSMVRNSWGCTIAGGMSNVAGTAYWQEPAAIGGGRGNEAHTAAFIGGGLDNYASDKGVVGGGFTNKAYGGSFVGGGEYNVASGGAVVGGSHNETHGDCFVGAGSYNIATNNGAVVVGGEHNRAGYMAFVGGGTNNTASGTHSTIGGGRNNTATNFFTTVGGGRENVAVGWYATVPGGVRANASHNNSFVWSGDETEETGSFADGTFTVRCEGGARFYTADGTSVGVSLASSGASWESLSDSNAKTKVSAINPREILAKLSRLPVTEWEYKGAPARRYIGPMAQDFHAAFGLGPSDKTISTLDSDGVMYAAIKGLVEELKERDAEIDALKGEVRAIREQLNKLPPAP